MAYYALKISYKGTRYCGWQVQKNGTSVQQTLQDAMEAAFGARIPVTGCSRTDAGVHAKGFVCTADGIPDSIPAEKIPLSLGSRLPDDIVVTEAWRVSPDFHPRYSALGKEYCYTLRNARIPDPFDSDFTVLYPTPAPLDVTKLDTLCKAFTGKHDFRSFMASGSDVEDTVRTVTDFRCERDGDLIRFTVSADGFLYNMVRILVGTVLELDSGVLTLSPEEIIESKDRKAAGKTMPAKGLMLTQVFYSV